MFREVISSILEIETIIFTIKLIIFAGLCHITLTLEKKKELKTEANFAGFLLLLFVLLFVLSH